MQELKTTINHFLRKSELVETPFVGQISDSKTNKWEKTVLVLLGTHRDRTGEFELSLNGGDEVYLAGIVGGNWEKWNKETIYSITSKQCGEFKGHAIFQIEISETVVG